jgi:hypothetical protein
MWSDPPGLAGRAGGSGIVILKLNA